MREIQLFFFMFPMLVSIETASGDDTLWHRYRQAVETIKDFECEYRLLSPPLSGLSLVAERGAESGGESLLVEAKYGPFRWSFLGNLVYFKELRFDGTLDPPNNWRDKTVFYDGVTSGYFHEFMRSGVIRSTRPEEIGLFANPASFFKPLYSTLASIEAEGKITIISEDSFRIDLETVDDKYSYKYEIELDPVHGFLPKSFKAYPLISPKQYNVFSNEKFVQLDGVWFPVKSRLRYFRETPLGPILETERVVEVDPSTLRINQGFVAKHFQFQFPDNIMFRNEVTGEYKASPDAEKIVRAYWALPRREALPRTPIPSEVRRAWLTGFWRLCLAGSFVLFLTVLLWNRRRILKRFGIGTLCLAIPFAGVSGCNLQSTSVGVSQIAIDIPEPQKITTVPVETAGIVETEFLIRNTGRARVYLDSPRAGCSCASATFSTAELGPSEEAILRVSTKYNSVQREVGHDVLFTVRDRSKQTSNFRVEVFVTRDCDWSVPFAPHLQLVANQINRSSIDIGFTGDKPQDISVHNSDGIECRIVGQADLSDSVVRLDVELLPHRISSTAYTDIFFVSTNKNPMVIKKPFPIDIGSKYGFSSHAYTMTGNNVALSIEGVSTASQIDLDSSPKGIIKLEVDSLNSRIMATREARADYHGVVKVFARVRIDGKDYLRDCLVLFE